MTTRVNVGDDDTAEYDYRIKIILLGDVHVGKSSFVKVLSEQKDPEQGCLCKEYQQNSFVEVECVRDEKRILAKVIDTGGQEKFRSLTASYYRGVHGCFILFDKKIEKTFDNVQSWWDELKSFCQQHVICTMLVGMTSSSQDNLISTERAMKRAGNMDNAEYSEVVLNNASHVVKALHRMLDCITSEIPQQTSLSVSIRPNPKKPKVKMFFGCAC